MHVKAHLLNSKGNIGSSKCQVLESASKTAVLRGISNWRSVGRQFGVHINRSAARLALTHPGSLQNVLRILTLRQK
jgi:hypothetical protein